MRLANARLFVSCFLYKCETYRKFEFLLNESMSGVNQSKMLQLPTYVDV